LVPVFAAGAVLFAPERVVPASLGAGAPETMFVETNLEYIAVLSSSESSMLYAAHAQTVSTA
jgi:hypothetical protein